MHGAVVLDTARRVTGSTPVFGVILAIGPVGGVLAIVRQRSLGLVVSELNGELATGRERHGIAILGGVV